MVRTLQNSFFYRWYLHFYFVMHIIIQSYLNLRCTPSYRCTFMYDVYHHACMHIDNLTFTPPPMLTLPNRRHLTHLTSRYDGATVQ
jgi:hypothetical protein